MILPYGWMVYGVPTTEGVRLTASRYVQGATVGSVWTRGGDLDPRLEFSAHLGRTEVIEAPDLREALEELYRRWS